MHEVWKVRVILKFCEVTSKRSWRIQEVWKVRDVQEVSEDQDVWNVRVVTGVSSLGVPGVPDFGRSVNPISTRGDRLCPPNYYWHPMCRWTGKYYVAL